MSAKAIREATGKDILNLHLGDVAGAAPCKFASVTEETNWNELVKNNPWLETTVSILPFHNDDDDFCLYTTLLLPSNFIATAAAIIAHTIYFLCLAYS